MRLAHLADVHLGFRQYHRLTSQGINQREADIAAAFRSAIDGVIQAAPDLVVISGDLFHSVRPTNPAILHSFHQLRRLRGALPNVPIVVVAGNHDTPRSTETGSILRLFEALDAVHVVAQEARELVFPSLDLAVLCVPHMALVSPARPTLVPGNDARRNILVTHGELAGMFRERDAVEYGGALLETADLHADRWDYVALGHYHVAHRVAHNTWFAGSLEYVSTNPWGELKDEAAEGRPGQKGWLLVELNSEARVEFRPVALARRHIDLEPIHASGLAADAVDSQIRKHVERVAGGIDDQVVRQLVYDIPRPVARELDYAYIRQLKTRALHFHLDLRRPQYRREIGVGVPGTRRTLTDIVSDYLSRRPIDADLDRTKLVALGRVYMEQVERALVEE